MRALNHRRRAERWISLLAALGCAAILALDWVLPLGYAVWALYMLPVTLTVRQSSARLPFVLAAVSMVFIFVGWAMSPGNGNVQLSLINRTLGVLTLFAVAAVVTRTLVVRRESDRQRWLQEGESLLSQRLLGELSVREVAEQACGALCELLNAPTAVLYRLQGGLLERVGGHAIDAASLPEHIGLGDGLLGQVAADGRLRLLEDLPPEHMAHAGPVRSALGASAPRHLVVAPLKAEGPICGVIEVAFSARRPTLDDERALVAQVSENIGLALRAAGYRERLEALLEETRRQSEALLHQQEELRTSNEELAEHGRVLSESQARLETQQVELEQTNVQLEEQRQALEQQRSQLLAAQDRLLTNAAQLEQASRYKSEFLANMSHELRTPLNSSLILAKLLADNREGRLSEEQVRYAEAIRAANNDLLVLINDILDLSKIESGHLELLAEEVPLDALLERLRTTFEPLAAHKRLGFSVHADPGAPAVLHTDGQRLQQVLKNLLANAVKFTEHGAVALHVRPVGPDRVAFAVSDSGIGIAQHQQQIIFEAFRQADGSTSRRFGGTGLGLSISRELAHRLGGEIRVDSEPGRGSTFTLALPVVLQAQPAAAPQATPEPAPSATTSWRAEAPVSTAPAAPAAPAEPINRRHPGRLILAVEDDPTFAALLCQMADEMGFDCVIAATAAEALRLARELQPSGILLDVGLPDQSGLGVLERLKRDPATRHLPVHVLSAHDRMQTALELGAVGYLMKPAGREELSEAMQRLQDRLQRRVRRVLIVEDDGVLRENLRLLLQAEDVEIQAVGRMDEALRLLSATTFDCMVLDLSLPDGSGYDLLERMAALDSVSFPPVIVYTGRALSREEEQRLRRHSKSIIVKGARSPERLLDEVTLFLHSVESRLPAEQQRLLRQARQRDAVLDGRTLLLVEDDVRNIFALSSVFEPLGVKLEIARNGREALERLDRGPEVDLVLMDIMMPEMDGITAMRHIRQRESLAQLPIIALTAKAMPDDRERCIEAGANDYVAKPIDIDKLVSLCRVWCPK